MNYDPIHDKCTLATESISTITKGITPNLLPSQNSATSNSWQNNTYLVPPNMSNEAPSIDTTPHRPASNLHQLLDNCNSDTDANVPQPTLEAKGSLTESSLTPQTTLKSSPGFVFREAMSGQKEGRNLSPNDDLTDGQNTTEQFQELSPSHKSMKNVKFSINNLVALDASDIDQKSIANKPGIHQHVVPLVNIINSDDQKGPDTLHHMGGTALDGEAQTPNSDSEVSLGSLPSDFRSISTGFKHLKKSDGEPFWRKDIQYDFLEELFNDKLQVFTNYFPHCEVINGANGPKLTFAELYVRTLAESSKSSKVLRERLIRDTEMGLSVSKVCLLVNAGRMNTTVNFVPDMRSALRTYHLIPSLQADPNGPSKPLQDTPRLKTILKAVCEGQDHLQSLLDILKEPATKKPNTNVIKLIFLMSTFFQNIPFQDDDTSNQTNPAEKVKNIKISSSHPNKFMDFFLEDEIYPKNRAKRFLWLMYTYMETSFTESELEQNPFNPKIIPPIEYIKPEDKNMFDNDTEFEIEYATKMYHARMMHLSEDFDHTTPKRGNRTKRERQSVKFSSENGGVQTGQDLIENETADDLMVVDETIIDEISEKIGMKPVEETLHNSTNAERAPRKKRAPSVNALVEEHKGDSRANSVWSNPEFPLANIKRIRTGFRTNTSQFSSGCLDKNSPLYLPRKKANLMKSTNIVSHISNSFPSYRARRNEVTRWLYQYFQYKKSTDNGLLAMEWENIRYDLANGIEAYLYQQLGKDFIAQSRDDKADDKHENGDCELARRGILSTITEPLPGDIAPIDLADIDTVGSGFLPSHDFDNVSQRSTYERSVVRLLEQVMIRNIHKNMMRTETIHFDLASEILEIREQK